MRHVSKLNVMADCFEAMVLPSARMLVSIVNLPSRFTRRTTNRQYGVAICLQHY